VLRRRCGLAEAVRRADDGVSAGRDEIAVMVRIETEVADEAAQPSDRSERSLRGPLHW
jgi:hypothetical protein